MAVALPDDAVQELAKGVYKHTPLVYAARAGDVSALKRAKEFGISPALIW